jgi:AcrR family transcriptional regulator
MSESTKAKLLDTAERLFGQNGYGATSLRQIIATAGVNLAAIHYHFGSKEELLDEIVSRQAGPVNAERVALLERAEAEAAGQPLPVPKILEALLRPMANAAQHRPEFVRLMGRIYAEGLMQGVVQRNFQIVITRFLPVLRRALSHLPDEEFLWRVHFMIGAMAHTMCGSPDFTHLEPIGFPQRIDLLIRFLTGGFETPALEPALTARNEVTS